MQDTVDILNGEDIYIYTHTHLILGRVQLRRVKINKESLKKKIEKINFAIWTIIIMIIIIILKIVIPF